MAVEKAASIPEHDEIVKGEGSIDVEVEEKGALMLDQHGYALVPQPTHFKDDPLNWPYWLKWLVLLQVSFLTFLGPFNSAVVNPALVSIAKTFHITPQAASYQTTAVIVSVGVSPLLWVPLANIYGRRPIYLISAIIGIVATVGSGLANTYPTLIVARVFSGVGVGAAMALGAATVNDMFFLHEKGLKMGIWTVFLTNGPHVGPIIGGYLIEATNYRWGYYVPAIVNSVSFLLMVFALPETLFSRSPDILACHQERTYMQMLFSFRKNMLHDRRLHARDFVRPFEMLKYPSVSITLLFYVVTFAYSTILPAVTIAALFTEIYHFKTGVIGLMIGLPLLIGSAVGECCSGSFSDWVVLRYAKRHGGVRKPESRLPASFGSVLLCPAGIIIYGVTLQKHTHWIGPCMGLVITSFGLQLVSTVNYTYCSGDCYKPQSAEIGSLYNVVRQVFAFPLGFYALPLADKVGIQNAWIIFAALILTSFIPTVVLLFKGEEWRKKFGQPQFHKDI
ncbi:hypothetical protein B7463_g4124, partial [Scytalidium lignicola]